jgi:hypothetical protein
VKKGLNIIAALWAADTAEQGDFRLLASLVRDGSDLSKHERELVADILEGKLKRRAGKPVDLVALQSKYIRIGDHVLDLQQTGLRRKAAVALAAEKFKTSERTVRKALKFVCEDLIESARLNQEC